MKKLLATIALGGLVFPTLVFAVFDDVSVTADANLSVNSITLNIAGSAATLETLTVDSTNFTAVLQSGSAIKVSPTTNKQMSYDVTYSGTGAPIVDYVCTSATSTLSVSASSRTTLVVTPLSTACSGPAESSSSISAGSGGGGGGGTTVTTPAPVVSVQSNAEAIAAIKTQLIVLIQELIAMLIQQLQQQIAEMQASGSY